MRRLITGFLLTLASTLLCLAGVELSLRLANYPAPPWAVPDRQLGWRWRPGVTGVFTDEGRGEIRINSLGLRGPELITPRPRVRVAVFGDSQTAAFQVNEDQSWVGRLGSELARGWGLPAAQVEVLNCAVNGWGTGEELSWLKRIGPRLQADLVVLAYYAGNDLRNNLGVEHASEERRRQRAGGEAAEPRFRAQRTVTAKGEVKVEGIRRFRWRDLSPSARRKIIHFWCNQNLHLYRLVARTLERRSQQANALDRDLPPGATPEAASGPTPGSSPGPTPAAAGPDWDEGWRRTRLLIASFAAEADRQGSLAMLVGLPADDQVSPLEQARKVLPGDRELEDTETRLAEVAREHAMVFTPLLEELNQAAEREGAELFGFGDRLGRGHLNPDGHRVAATQVARSLLTAFPAPPARRASP